MKKLIIICLSVFPLLAFCDRLEWDPSTTDVYGDALPSPALYRVEYCHEEIVMDGMNFTKVYVDPEYAFAGTNCTWDMSTLVTGVTYRISVRAYLGDEYSDPSEYLVNRIPLPPSTNTVSGTFTAAFVAYKPPMGNAYYTLLECTNLIDGIWTPVDGFIAIKGDDEVYEYIREPDCDAAFYRLEVTE